MKLSEMITYLEEYKAKIGDVDVTADVTFNLAEISAETDPLTEKINRLRKQYKDREALKEKNPKPRLSKVQKEARDRLKQERPGILSD